MNSTAVYLSVVIPAYNEEQRLPPTLRDALSYLQTQPYEWEILVSNDGSTDRTADVVAEFTKMDRRIQLLGSSTNYGKGSAVRRGMLAARGEYRLFMDADGSTKLREVERLLSATRAGAQVAFGSRALESDEVTIDARWYRRYPGRIFNWCVNRILGLGLADTQCGFKLFSASAADLLFPLQETPGFGFDLEVLYLAKKRGFTLAEVPVNWANVPGSKVSVLRDGLKMLRDAIRIRHRHAA